MPDMPQPAAERTVVLLDENTAVILVIGVATLLVAFVGLVIKLIELGRK
jgi:type IV secretory pathway TrbD component